MKLGFFFIVAIAAWPMVGAAQAVATNRVIFTETARAMDALDDTRKLGLGDRIFYQVIEDRDDPRLLTVTDSGDLEVPYYGLVRAAGKTSRQLAREIKRLLEQKLYFQATVVLAIEVANVTRITGKVYVNGKVRNPGGYDIPAGETMTVSKAISCAGGFSDFANKKRVLLNRKTAQGKETTFPVNVAEVLKGHLDKDLEVQPGDQVVVPASLVNY